MSMSVHVRMLKKNRENVKAHNISILSMLNAKGTHLTSSIHIHIHRLFARYSASSGRRLFAID